MISEQASGWMDHQAAVFAFLLSSAWFCRMVVPNSLYGHAKGMAAHAPVCSAKT